jgi:hypothetical protein
MLLLRNFAQLRGYLDEDVVILEDRRGCCTITLTDITESFASLASA